MTDRQGHARIGDIRRLIRNSLCSPPEKDRAFLHQSTPFDYYRGTYNRTPHISSSIEMIQDHKSAIRIVTVELGGVFVSARFRKPLSFGSRWSSDRDPVLCARHIHRYLPFRIVHGAGVRLPRSRTYEPVLGNLHRFRPDFDNRCQVRVFGF